jgi:hypothetical protein
LATRAGHEFAAKHLEPLRVHQENRRTVRVLRQPALVEPPPDEQRCDSGDRDRNADVQQLFGVLQAGR